MRNPNQAGDWIKQDRTLGLRLDVTDGESIRAAMDRAKTDFYDRSLEVMTRPGLTAYHGFVARAMRTMQKAGADAPGPEIVARTIYRAATDGRHRLRYPANSASILLLRRLLPTGVFMGLAKRLVLK
jgi:hypothetical protein